MIKFARYVAYLLLATNVCACLKTPLPAFSVDKNIFRLQSLNTKEIGLQVTQVANASLGRQFLFLVIPFGRVVEPNFTQRAYDIAFQDLSMRGYRTVARSSMLSSTPQLRIIPVNLSLDAYDFIFFRKIVARVELELRFGTTRIEWTTAEESTYTRTAFASELGVIFDKTLSKALNRGFEALGL